MRPGGEEAALHGPDVRHRSHLTSNTASVTGDEPRRSCGQSLRWIKDWQQVRAPLSQTEQSGAPKSAADLSCQSLFNCWITVGTYMPVGSSGMMGCSWDCESTHSFEASLTLTRSLAAVIHHPRPLFTLQGSKAGWSPCPHRNSDYFSSADNSMWGSSKTEKRYCV